jgi:hypothetical protein
MFQDMGLAKMYAALIGVVLVLVGLLGFVSNPIVGDPSSNPLFVTGTVHNLVHLLTGALALYVAFGLRGEQQVWGVIGIGVLYAAVFVLLLISPNLFGILGGDAYKVNIADHVLHLGLAVASLGVGWYVRSGARGMNRMAAR